MFRNPVEFQDFLDHKLGRTPYVFRRCLAEPLATEEEVLTCVRQSFLNPYDGKLDKGSRIWVEGKRITKQLDSYIPSDDHKGLHEFIESLYQRDIRHICISSWKPHLYKNEMFDRMESFTQPVVARTGFPSGGIGSDIFLGDYKVTPGSLHIDGTDVFSFVVAGRKKMLVWPFHVFEKFTKIKRGGYDILMDVNYEDFLDQAIVLEGEPGDILYWPYDYWHVAEGDGTPVATFNISLYIIESKDRFLKEAFTEAFEQGDRQDFLGFDEIRAPVSRTEIFERLIEQEMIKKEKFLSLKGILGNPEKIAGSPDLHSGHWAIHPQWEPLCHATANRTIISCRGRTIILPKLTFFQELITYLKQCSRFSLPDIISHFEIPEDNPLVSRIEKILQLLYSYGGLVAA